MADLYRDKVERPQESLNDEDSRGEAAKHCANFVEEIRVVPEDGLRRYRGTRPLTSLARSRH